MQYLEVVQRGQALHNLDEDVPYFLLLELPSLALVLKYFLEQIPPVSIFHDNTALGKWYHSDLVVES